MSTLYVFPPSPSFSIISFHHHYHHHQYCTSKLCLCCLTEALRMSSRQKQMLGIIKHYLYSNPKILYAPNNTAADEVIKKVVGMIGASCCCCCFVFNLPLLLSWMFELIVWTHAVLAVLFDCLDTCCFGCLI